jgi:hypothetical protein
LSQFIWLFGFCWSRPATNISMRSDTNSLHSALHSLDSVLHVFSGCQHTQIQNKITERHNLARSKIKRCLPFDLVTILKGDTHLGWVCHFIIAFARRRSKMEDVTKSLQASASLLFCWRKGGAGLVRNYQNKGKPCCTH